MVKSSAIALPGYHITEPLYTASRTLVYRAVREADLQPVIIKLLRNEHPSFSELVQFRNQYTIAKNLEIPGIVKPYSLEPYRNGYALVMEDFGGISLRHFANKRQFPLEQFFAIALQLVDILHQLHQQRVIHKDIKPANILIQPDTQQVKLIDFSISSLLPRETQELKNPNVLEGTLAYLSPEQTGRMNRGIDYRSDFYSLGVTFFELLTGQQPFESHDPKELLHCHLAKQPPDACDINPELPLMLGEIVGKLMAKNAEDRYQSALGLKHDLMKCQQQWQATGKHAWFELGQRDVCDRFLIPEKLYGREEEAQTLLEAFGRVANGAAELMLVAGFSGIGKTAVVNEVHKPIVRSNGYFIKGKFDQFNRNIPLNAFVQAFRNLMGQLLSESDEQLKQWQDKILLALGENGQVLIEVIPELEQIIGKQPAVPELSGSAAQNRFNLLFVNFISVFTTQEHPLVMFLDDLQWADSASLNLMQVLMSQQEAGYLFIIGAYRDNEVFPAHPLMLTLGELAKAEATVRTLTLQPLLQSDVNHLIADTLSCAIDQAVPLTELVYQKTKGNPFFTTQFLKSLHQEGYIAFDPQVGHWQCDMAVVRSLSLTDDVVEFMALQLKKLPLETQTMLKLAACIGAQFDLSTLAIVSERSQTEVATALWKALQEGLILPISETYKFFQAADTETLAPEIVVPYKFLHDRVQQAAYSLIPDEQKQATHLLIARLLGENTPDAELEANIFEIVNHWNKSITLVINAAEKINLAELNLIAGRKAKASTAHEPALEYFQTGLSLLSDGWQTQPKLMLALQEGAAEAAYLCGDIAQTEQWVNEILAQNLNPIDRVKAYEIQLQAYNAIGRFQEAISIGCTALKQFNVHLPQEPTPADIAPALQEVTELLNGRTALELLDLPVMTAAEPLAVMQLLSSVIVTAYASAPLLFPLLVLTQVKFSIQQGNSALSAYAYSTYGMLLSGILEDLNAAYEFGQLGLKQVAKLNARTILPKVNLVVGVGSMHCKSHLRESLPLLVEGFSVGLEVGDLEFAGYNAISHYQFAYLIGKNLTTLVAETEPYLATLLKLNQTTASNSSYCVLYSIQRLQGNHSQTASEEQLHTALTAVNDLLGLHFYWVYQLTASYLLNETARAMQEADQARQTLAVTNLITVPTFYFYDSLTALASYADATDKTVLLDRVAENQAKLHHRAYHAPMNFQHKYDLVEAEKHRVLGNKAEAIELYDKAIAGANANDYIQEAALANELAAKFYLDWGKERIAQDYMIEAYYGYARWGAKAKVADLETRYPQLLAPIFPQTRTALCVNETVFAAGTVTSTSSSTSISDSLDLAAILKASQTLSGEIELDKLLSTLLSTIIQTAGADKCVLMLHEDKGLMVQATAELMASNQIQAIMQPSPVPVQKSREIPISLINSVKRSLQPAVINNAIVELQLANDAYIQTQQPKSILCSPILHQGKLLGIVYLENNLATGAFTSDRVELLNLLCAQAAISLENARLYQQAQDALTHLQQMQLQLVQSEKMSALGNLVAGVAHEMNNPLGFIAASLEQAKPTVADIVDHLKLYQESLPNKSDEILDHAEEIDLDYSLSDLPKAIDAMGMACDRLKNISTSLRTFSRADRDYKVPFNIHEGIDSTLLILKHRLKANSQRPAIEVVTNYGNLPQIDCFPGQLNQVFMNILANAIDALDESNTHRSFAEIKANTNQIAIQTSLVNKLVKISIADNGKGMSAEVKAKIFDHLFTTKTVGKGTGLGLAIARQIVVEKHGGAIAVNSTAGMGTEFAIALPVQANGSA